MTYLEKLFKLATTGLEEDIYIKKLVEIVKVQKKALKAISKDFGTDYCDGNCVKAKLALDKIEKIAGSDK